MFELILFLGIPAIIALVMMLGKLSLMKTAVNQDMAFSNIKKDGIDIFIKNDTFLYSSVTKTPRPKSKN